MHKRLASSPEIVPEAKVLVSVDEAAALLSIGRSAIYDLLKYGELRGVKVGRNRRVVVASLHEYVGRLLGQAS